MTLDELKSKKINLESSALNILMRNNALLESIADLIIKISAKDDNHSKELSVFFNESLKENFENALNLLSVSESQDSSRYL